MKKTYYYLPLDSFNQPSGLVKEIELTTLELEKELEKKYSNKRFKIKELEKSLNFHFDLKGNKKFKFEKPERVLKENDFELLFTIYPEKNIFFDITIFYLKTNAKGYIYITEFYIESFNF